MRLLTKLASSIRTFSQRLRSKEWASVGRLQAGRVGGTGRASPPARVPEDRHRPARAIDISFDRCGLAVGFGRDHCGLAEKTHPGASVVVGAARPDDLVPLGAVLLPMGRSGSPYPDVTVTSGDVIEVRLTFRRRWRKAFEEVIGSAWLGAGAVGVLMEVDRDAKEVRLVIPQDPVPGRG